MTSSGVDYVLTVDWHYPDGSSGVSSAEGFAEVSAGETEYQVMGRCLEILETRTEAASGRKARARVILFWHMMSWEPLA